MEKISEIDVSFSTWVQRHFMTDRQTAFWKFITSLADYGWFWFVSIIIFCIKPSTRSAGIHALFSLGLCFLTTNIILKNLCGRRRPFQHEGGITALIREPEDLSFPSGHTTASFACAFVYARMLPLTAAAPFLIVAGLIGWSRIYLGVHYLSDVLGGICVPLLISTLVCAF